MSPANISSTIKVAHDDKLFNYQRNNSTRRIQPYKWQSGKADNIGDPNPYVHEDSNKKHERTCTNTSLCVEGKSRKVTQPPNVIQSYGTLSSKCNERRGIEQNEYERNHAQIQAQKESKTSLRMVSDSMVATKQTSRHRDSIENAAECFTPDFYRVNRHDKYQSFQNRRVLSDADMEQANPNQDLSGHSEMPFPSSLSNVQQENFSVSLTSNVSETIEPSKCSDALAPLRIPCNSNVLLYKNDLDYQLRRKITRIDVEPIIHNGNVNEIKCTVDENETENEQQNRVKVFISSEINHENRAEGANSNAKSFQSANISSSESINRSLTNADNSMITSAIKDPSVLAVTTETSGKAKYLNDIVTLREKRRQGRRDRRLARTRATNGASISSTTGNEILREINIKVRNHLSHIAKRLFKEHLHESFS